MVKAKGKKNDQFIKDMIRCRGIEFAQIGMQVEVDGAIGTIVGMNSSANLDVLFSNQLYFGRRPINCHPTYNIKYFDENGKVIANFIECECLFIPNTEEGKANG